MQKERLYYLLNQRFNSNATPEEDSELEKMLTALHSNQLLNEWMEQQWENYTPAESISQQTAAAYFKRIMNEAEKKEAAQTIVADMPVRKRFNWLRVAAVFLLLLTGVTIYYFIKPTPGKPTKVAGTTHNDVAPGGNFATLTLGDGTTLTLDSAANGLLASQGNTRIVKLDNGQVKYEGGKQDNTISYNTMSTPNGGQYKLWLPDGTAVWLNAASSITYPTAFTGNKRQVSITGEVYFEVTKNAKQPFAVTVGEQTIEVLGTHFNINAYKDEDAINTTLTEGSVLVKANGKTLTLKPGQQAQNNYKGQLSLNLHPDIEETLAWKDGLFHFNGTPIQSIMKQLSRWYDVEIVYKDEISELFVADIPRNVKVSKLLELLELTKHVRFSILGKTITVSKF